MSTVVSRALSKRDVYDLIAIKVDKEEYKEKYGVLLLTINSYTWGTPPDTDPLPSPGRFDLRVPRYNPDCDTPIVNNAAVSTEAGTVTLSSNNEYTFAINNGVCPPSAFEQPDGTWDLMWGKWEMPFEYTGAGIALTVDYTLTFTDLTPEE